MVRNISNRMQGSDNRLVFFSVGTMVSLHLQLELIYVLAIMRVYTHFGDLCKVKIEIVR